MKTTLDWIMFAVLLAIAWYLIFYAVLTLALGAI